MYILYIVNLNINENWIYLTVNTYFKHRTGLINAIVSTIKYINMNNLILCNSHF